MPKIIQMALEYLQIQSKACTSLCFSASPPRIGIFRFDCIKACLRHDLSRHVESARRNMKIEASDQIPHPLWVVIKCPAPGKTKFIKFSPSRAAKNVKCPGYARGGGGCLIVNLTGTQQYSLQQWYDQKYRPDVEVHLLESCWKL